MRLLIWSPCPTSKGMVVLFWALMGSVFFSSCAGVRRGAPAKPEPVTTVTVTPTQPGLQWEPISADQVAGQFPYALAFDHETKTLFFTDILNNVVCLRNPDGTVGVLTESVSLGLSLPLALAYVSPMTLVIADTGNKRLCLLTPEGIVPELLLSEGRITGLAVVPGGAIYYSDFDSCTVVKATVDGSQTVVAGVGSPGYSGDGGVGTSAALNGPYGLARYNNRLFIADSLNHRIRVLDLTTGEIRTFAGNGSRGTSIPTSPVNGLDVALNDPRGVAVDQAGRVYVLNTGGTGISAGLTGSKPVPPILCFDQNGLLLPQMLKADLGADARPACAVVMDGDLAYTDLVSPGVRPVAIAPAECGVRNAECGIGEGSEEKSEPPAPGAEGSAPPTEEKKPEPEPPAPAAEGLRLEASGVRPGKTQASRLTPPGPDITTCRLVGPRSVIDTPSVAYSLVLDIAGGVQIGAVVAEVQFNPEHLKVISVVGGTGFQPVRPAGMPVPPGTGRRSHISQSQDSVTFTMHTRAGTSPLSGTIELCDLLFECIWDHEIPTVTELVVAAPTVITQDGIPVSSEAENFFTTNFPYGDVNRDSKVDLVDALLLLYSSQSMERVEESTMRLLGDVDLDDVLTIADALAIVRSIPDDGLQLPTIPPRDKAEWSSDDAMLQDALAGETDEKKTTGLASLSKKKREELKATWTKNLVKAGAVLFVRVPEYVPSDQRELLLDVMLGLPEGKRLGAFEVAIDFDSDHITVEKVFLDDQGPNGIVGTAQVAHSRVYVGGVCRSPGDATAATVKLASLLTSLKPPTDIDDGGARERRSRGAREWDTTLRPVARELIDDQGSAMFGFGAPSTICTYRSGDITKDGEVDDVDLLLFLESLTGKGDTAQLRSPKAADLDVDGEYTIRDAVLLAKVANGEVFLDVTTPSGKQIAAEYVVRQLLSGTEREASGLLPPMTDLLRKRSRGAKTLDRILETHSIVGLDAPIMAGEGGHFLGTLVCQPRPGMSLSGYQVEIECEPDVLSIQAVMPAAVMESIDRPIVYHISQDQSRLILSQIPNLDSIEETRQILLASILFRMKTDRDDPPTSTSIRLTSHGVVDRHGRLVDTVCPGHTVANFLPGDVNGDGSVERLDEVLLSRVVAGEIRSETLRNPAAADLNLDGQIDMADVVLLEQATLGQTGFEIVRRARRRTAIQQEINRTP